MQTTLHYKVTDIRYTTHTSLTVKFSVPCTQVHTEFSCISAVPTSTEYYTTRVSWTLHDYTILSQSPTASACKGTLLYILASYTLYYVHYTRNFLSTD